MTLAVGLILEVRFKTFGVRREAKRHVALAGLPALEKRCRRCALPPQSKILAVRVGSDGEHCNGDAVAPQRDGSGAFSTLKRRAEANRGLLIFQRANGPQVIRKVGV